MNSSTNITASHKYTSVAQEKDNWGNKTVYDNTLRSPQNALRHANSGLTPWTLHPSRLLIKFTHIHLPYAALFPPPKTTNSKYRKMSSSPASKIYLRPHHEPGRKQATRTYIIYFVTGNPGLIEYYRTFLTHLYGVLTRDTASNRDVEFQVYGRSLSGFEMKSHEINTMKWHKIPPYGLQDQIRHAEDELADLVEDVSDDGQRDVRVVVMGHSVGSFIALEIIRRLRAHGLVGEDYATRIVGGISLFPTIMEIFKSENGQKAGVCVFCLLLVTCFC
jgi:hypothetical protein